MLVAHVWLVAIRRLECKAPSNQNVRYLYLPSLDLVQRERFSELLADITKSPIILYNQGLMGSIYKSLTQPNNNKSRPIDCAMCVRGMCSIEL